MKLGAWHESLRAAIGPCIGRQSYEISAGFMNPFLAQDEGSAVFFSAGKNESARQFDLPGYVGQRLRQAGVKHISSCGADTYEKENDYFSYRRTTHRGEPDYGRQLSIISISS